VSFILSKIASHKSISARRVIIIANYFPDRQESMLKLADMFCAVLEECGLEVEVLRPIDWIGRARVFFPSFQKWLGYVDKYIIFSFKLLVHKWRMRDRTDLVYHIVDHSNAIYSFLLSARPHIVTCNDVLAIRSALGEIPENPTKLTGRVLQKSILAGLRRTPRVVCISKNSQNELSRLLREQKPKITFVSLPLNFDFHPLAREEAMGYLRCLGNALSWVGEAGFILHIGGNQWYKNRIGVLKIFAELCFMRSNIGLPLVPLLLAGKEPSEELRRFVEENHKVPIHFVVDPSTPALRALYSLAKIFVFPSLQEGFGWPILESMACGCPVVTTGRPPMTEVGGSAAIYIKPEKVADSARVLNDILEWPAQKHSDCVEKGFKNLRRFTRENFTAHYLAAYSDVLKEQSKF
jgi:glycosyltransferase involved in cell wall biosynthesis